MRIISRPRRGGKTYELLQVVVQHNALMLCVDEGSARMTRDMATRLFPEIESTFWLNSIRVANEHIAQGHNRPIVVDNADWLLEHYLGRRPTAISVTGEG